MFCYQKKHCQSSNNFIPFFMSNVRFMQSTSTFLSDCKSESGSKIPPKVKSECRTDSESGESSSGETSSSGEDDVPLCASEVGEDYPLSSKLSEGLPTSTSALSRLGSESCSGPPGYTDGTSFIPGGIRMAGDYPAEYNAKVHGPYDPSRFYGKPDTPFGQVKLNELGSWFGRRNKDPRAGVALISRAYWRWQHKYMLPKKAGIAPFLQFATCSMIIMYSLNRYKIRYHKGFKYH